MVYTFLRADVETHNSEVRTYKGKELIPVAKQVSLRAINPKKERYIYLLEGTNQLYQKYGAFYVPLYAHTQEMSTRVLQR